MISRKDSNRLNNYEALKAYILERGHLPDKHVVTNRLLLSKVPKEEDQGRNAGC